MADRGYKSGVTMYLDGKKVLRVARVVGEVGTCTMGAMRVVRATLTGGTQPLTKREWWRPPFARISMFSCYNGITNPIQTFHFPLVQWNKVCSPCLVVYSFDVITMKTR